MFTDRAKDAGMSADLRKYLISTIGVTNTVGRILCGALTSLPSVNALLINNLALSLGGLATICSGLSMTNIYQFSYAAVFGFAIGKSNDRLLRLKTGQVQGVKCFYRRRL